MTRNENRIIVFFILIISAGLIFLSLSRFNIYQKYIQINIKNQNIDNYRVTSDTLLSDIEERERRSVDINSADLSTLIELPGIGRETALNIIEYRTNNGPFSNFDEILQVKGIGVKKLEMLKRYVIIK